MKATSSALRIHMAGPLTTMCTLVDVTRKDGFVLAITDHDTDIAFGGLTYLSTLAFDASNVDQTAELNVDNLEVSGYLSDSGVSEAGVAAGLWDFAEVRVQRVNWQDLTQGSDKIKRGWVGEISVGRNSFTNEIRGLTQKLQQAIGEGYSPSCKADVFDDRCKLVPIEGVWKFSGIAVTSIVDAQRQWTSSGLTQPADFFTEGKVVWTVGANAGLSKEIKLHTAGGGIVLHEPMPYPITTSDTFVIYAGCQKRWELDCKDKFSNTDNFRGFPFLPGDDVTLRGY